MLDKHAALMYNNNIILNPYGKVNNTNSITKKTLREAFVSCMPVLAGFAFLGIAFGILLVSKGYSAVWAIAMSFICFCGSMQYAAISLLCAAFDPLAALLLSIMVNARHIFYGLSFLEKYKGLGKCKPFLVYTLCDESFSILSAKLPDGVDEKQYYIFVSLFNYLYWGLATTVGAVAGQLLVRLEGFDTTGFDFVLTALFVVIFIDSVREKEKRIPAAIGVACSVGSLLIFGAGDFIIPAMAAIFAVLALYMKWGDKHGNAQ